MTLPVLEINLCKLAYNAKIEVCLLAQYGVTVMGVNKVFNGLVETAEALIKGDITTIAESRIANLKRMQHLPCEKCLLRTPTPSEISDTIRFADISLGSDRETIKELGIEASRQERHHQILLMVDMGDLREGIWFESYAEIVAAIKEILRWPWLQLYGLGTNFSCYGTIILTKEHLDLFVDLALKLERDLELRFKYLSGGNCTSYHLMHNGQWNPRINHLWIGGLHQFGIEYVDMKYVNCFFHSQKECKLAVSDLYLFKAEIIEIYHKPTMPYGKLGVDAFLQ
ncbi:MAG: alanine racemase, partial [Oligoflexia bacterium]|nr:alanine racemase [Oligoflexia bacterium]